MPRLALDWNRYRPRLAYGAFFVLAFLVALRLTFPSEAVKERLIVEAGARGFTFDAAEVGPAGVLGVSASGVRLEDSAGLAISIERLAASLRVLPLLAGRRSVDVDLAIWDGRVRGTADLGSGARAYHFRAEDVELARALPLRTATKLELVGRVEGTLDLEYPDAPRGVPEGKVQLRIAGAGVNGGQLALPGMGSGLSLPKVSLGDVNAVVTLAAGKGTAERLEAKGGDAELSADGLSVALQPRVENSGLFGVARLRVKDALWTKSGTGAFKGLFESAFASSRGPDGAYAFQIYGSLAHPQFRAGGMGNSSAPGGLPPNGRSLRRFQED